MNRLLQVPAANDRKGCIHHEWQSCTQLGCILQAVDGSQTTDKQPVQGLASAYAWTSISIAGPGCFGLLLLGG